MIAATLHRMAHPPAPQLIVSPAERAVLDRLVRARTSEQRLAQRARIVIRAADGVANKRISAELGVNLMTVLLWRRRFEAERLAGLRDAPRPGRTPTYTRADRDRVIALKATSDRMRRTLVAPEESRYAFECRCDDGPALFHPGAGNVSVRRS